MNREKRDEIETGYYKEYRAHYLDFVKMLTLLSGAIIPVVLSISQGITPVPRLLQCAAFGHLFALFAGLFCIWKVTVRPLGVIAKSIHEAIQDPQDHPSTVQSWESLLPSTTERRAHIIQLWLFGLSFVPIVLYFFLL